MQLCRGLSVPRIIITVIGCSWCGAAKTAEEECGPAAARLSLHISFCLVFFAVFVSSAPLFIFRRVFFLCACVFRRHLGSDGLNRPDGADRESGVCGGSLGEMLRPRDVLHPSMCHTVVVAGLHYGDLSTRGKSRPLAQPLPSPLNYRGTYSQTCPTTEDDAHSTVSRWCMGLRESLLTIVVRR